MRLRPGRNALVPPLVGGAILLLMALLPTARVGAADAWLPVRETSLVVQPGSPLDFSSLLPNPVIGPGNFLTIGAGGHLAYSAAPDEPADDAVFDLSGLFGPQPLESEAAREFVRTLAQANAGDIEQLHQARNRGDRKALGDLAHRLAGAAAIIGAAAAEGHCRALQRICEGDGEGLEARLGQADAALAELQRALADWLARAAG